MQTLKRTSKKKKNKQTIHSSSKRNTQSQHTERKHGSNSFIAIRGHCLRWQRIENVLKSDGARSLQWWTTTRRPQRRPDFRRRRRTRPVDMVGHRAGHFLRPTRRAPSTCIVQAPQPQQQPQPRTQQSPATSRPQLVRNPLRPRSLRSPCLVPRSTTVP